MGYLPGILVLRGKRGFQRPSLVCAVLCTAALLAGFPCRAAAAGSTEDRGATFLELLRTYPERPAHETLARVARLVEAGDFPGRDRAEYWIGAASLAAGERRSARAWFSRLLHDYPASPWVERSLLGLGDAAAQERDYGAALALYARATSARDPAVRELARLSSAQVRALRQRQLLAYAAALLALAVAVWFALGVRRPFWPPAELRIAGPVLAVLALLSTRLDPAPRAAVLEICAASALLLWLSGARLIAQPRARRGLHALLALAALGCAAYACIYRNDLTGTVIETVRSGTQ